MTSYLIIYDDVATKLKPKNQGSITSLLKENEKVRKAQQI